MNVAEPSEASTGSIRLGPYRVIRKIGSGGMASVFEAIDEHLGHRVAVKRLHPHVADRRGASERFLREGRATARIRHPHVVQVLALGMDDGAPYLAMEFLEGQNLAQILSRDGRLSTDQALGIVLPVIAAIGAAHDARVLHRDLKPSNVFIERRNGGITWPKVVDFGVSKVVSHAPLEAMTTSGSLIGTPAYMAPEQLQAADGASFVSDQYALAVLLYECVTGGRPFVGRSPYGLVEAIMTAPVTPPSAHAPNIPRELEEIILQGMDRDPCRRFPTVRAFGAALLPFAAERTRWVWRAEFQDETETAARLATPALSSERASNVDPATIAGDTHAPKHTRVAARRPGVLAAIGFVAILVVSWRVVVGPPARWDDRADRASIVTANPGAIVPLHLAPEWVSPSSVPDEALPRVPRTGARPRSRSTSVNRKPSAAPSRTASFPSARGEGASVLAVGDNGALVLP